MPVTIVVEDGTGLGTADAYVSVAEAATLLSFHPDEATWSALTQTQQEDAIKAATEFLDMRWRWYGQVNTTTQALQWPRTKMLNSKGRWLAAGAIPTELKKATAYIAITAVKEVTLNELVRETGAVKQYFTDGLNILFDPKTTEAAQIMGKRLIELELMLKNMGTFADVDWISSRRSVVVS